LVELGRERGERVRREAVAFRGAVWIANSMEGVEDVEGGGEHEVGGGGGVTVVWSQVASAGLRAGVRVYVLCARVEVTKGGDDRGFYAIENETRNVIALYFASLRDSSSTALEAKSKRPELVPTPSTRFLPSRSRR
jgi:hypothetical protein|tara:strand:+ start:9366 stop:9773 length:408 start_codon:yes stop_codon:yes gene_type:complete